MKNLVLMLIRLYQKTFIFHIGFFRRLFMIDRLCRFSPTCSEYTYKAVKKYGAVKGPIIGFKRIIRCHPWNKGGYDPIP